MDRRTVGFDLLHHIFVTPFQVLFRAFEYPPLSIFHYRQHQQADQYEYALYLYVQQFETTPGVYIFVFFYEYVLLKFYEQQYLHTF